MSGRLSSVAAAIHAFATSPLEEAGRGLLHSLGYRSAKTIPLDGSPASFARDVDPEGRLNARAAQLDRWCEVRFLFQLTNDEIPMLGRGQADFDLAERFGRSIVDSFVFLAIELEGEEWTRSSLAGVTRAVNACFPMPVIILFRHGGFVSLAVSERRANRRDASRDVQTGRISIILNIVIDRPHRGHLSILGKLDLTAMPRRPANFDELYRGWLQALSTKTLNQTFYRDLSHWFFWAKREVVFPPGAGSRVEVPLIRLLTRVIFCWFIKERRLIPPELFRSENVAELLRADPAATPAEGTYYRAILQNLFFATLNTEMPRPGQEGVRTWINGQHLVHSLYRYKDLFADPDAALALFRQVPFLNGGLFECLDRELTERDLARDPDLLKLSDGKRLRIDGFSDHPKNPLHVPNRVFFGEEIEVDLNADFETKGKTYRAKGLFTLFEDYVFTVEENTAAEEEVALDPELLGKVFENLLASYNEETRTTARKKSGSFYTPRYVVDWMVRETLAHQFTRALITARPAEAGLRPDAEAFDFGSAPGELAIDRPPSRPTAATVREAFDARVRTLLDPAAETPRFSGAETQALVAAIEELKVLDPACGSGAFPMGMLQSLMAVLKRLDPDNARWRATLRRPLEDRVTRARDYDVTRREVELEEAEAALAAFDEEFADPDLVDYVRKLHLIERCLYGSDIQPIAIQIAKLRFFISLAVEQRPHLGRDNLGVKPLPNLETKLVAANSLVPLDRPPQGDLFANPRIRDLERLIEDATQRHFGARTMRTKRKYRALIEQHRDELAAILEAEHSLPHDDANKAAAWDPFDQNATAPFFDPLWMFGLHDGFDIVIGNPPYIRQERFTEQKPLLRRLYERRDRNGQVEGSYAGTADYLVYFIERGVSLLKAGGAFSYITSNKWFRAKYGENLRWWMSRHTDLLSIIDFGDADVFEGTIAYPTIVTAERRDGEVRAGHRFRALNWSELGEDADEERFPFYLESAGFDMPQVALERTGWQVEPTVKRDVLARIRAAGVPLGDYVEGRFYRGILTGYNDAFVIDGATRARLIAEDEAANEIIKPYLRGRDVKRWRVEPEDLWLIFTRRGIDIDAYPSVKAHLVQYRDALEPKPSDWEPTGEETSWPGRKAGSYQWFEIQDNVAYWREFEQPKIVVPAIEKRVAYAFDGEGFYSNDKTSIIVDDRWRYLLACLNSSVSWWYTQALFASRTGGFYEFKPMYVSVLPIPSATTEQQRLLEALATALTAEPSSALEQLLNGLVYELYFPDDLQERGLHLHAAAAEAGLDSLVGLDGSTLTTAAAAFSRARLAPGEPLRIMLSDLQTLDVVRIIEGKA
ncbi:MULTISPECIES: Eco57I restriction-modification methylase domain-containing protein [unclassified Sphingomonas]|uniref:Eco57I restriction-modification methylase domain-containing protein n=1 Tax=unclassified Sphingomonas TaxID=196159 RepID=UPI002857E199|nr:MULTISPECIES: TaqI-like C-terminal specificity domain-containing protein [unclassified Sphingomonas]MDR6114495.1 adenine-specific DNA-methyltransferase [Sphingomonas sp. SORGH_AS_0789]MDR6148146.1 adenine-specific DNA-methyltransferase [Sphingomonas sp. SORGH_AS_0742]